MRTKDHILHSEIKCGSSSNVSLPRILRSSSVLYQNLAQVYASIRLMTWLYIHIMGSLSFWINTLCNKKGLVLFLLHYMYDF